MSNPDQARIYTAQPGVASCPGPCHTPGIQDTFLPVGGSDVTALKDPPWKRRRQEGDWKMLFKNGLDPHSALELNKFSNIVFIIVPKVPQWRIRG